VRFPETEGGVGVGVQPVYQLYSEWGTGDEWLTTGGEWVAVDGVQSVGFSLDNNDIPSVIDHSRSPTIGIRILYHVSR